jgi:hypothetical protein
VQPITRFATTLSLDAAWAGEALNASSAILGKARTLNAEDPVGGSLLAVSMSLNYAGALLGMFSSLMGFLLSRCR